MICNNCGSFYSGSTCKICPTIPGVKLKGKRVENTKVLEAKLDIIYSEYTRKRDAIKFSGGVEVKCITCDTRGHWKEFQNGHYISRRHLSTRYHDHNNHAQCEECNCFKNGNTEEYKKVIDSLYGSGYSDRLLHLSRQSVKWGFWEFEQLIDDYTQRIKDLDELLKNKSN